VNRGTAAPLPRSRGRRVVRLIVAAFLVGFFFWRADPRSVVGAFAGLNLGPLLVVVALVLLDRAIMAYRWLALLRPLDAAHLPSFAAILRIFFVSTFAGTFLPASIGGDVVRAYSLAAQGVPMSDSTASVFVDRMLGVLSLLIMAIVSLSLARDLSGDPTILAGLAGAAAACAAAGLLVFSNAADAVAESLLARVPWQSLRRVPANILTSIRRYARHHGALVYVLGASIAVQILRVVQAYYLGTALGLMQPMWSYFAFVPLILLVMLLPITVNGIGTSQAAFVWLFSRVGTPAHDAFALSVLFLGLQIIGNIPGAFFVVADAVSGRRPPRLEQQ
jgi:uncharacterized membrane protein YbhN (UPF0104 family)